MDTKLSCMLLVLLQSVSVFSVTSQCGAGTCGDAGGVCEKDICYCKPLFYGPTCSSGCAPCVPVTDVCTNATACEDCPNGCTNGGTCATVDDTPTCKCPAANTGDTCQLECTSPSCTVYEKCTGTGPAACECKGGLKPAGTCKTVDCTAGQPCMNGGTCSAPKCDCDTEYGGIICQHACVGGCNTGTCVANTADDAGECDCPATHVGDKCQYECPTCGADEKCRETPAGGSPECAAKCSGTPPCGGATNGVCVDEVCSCTSNKAGDDCSLTCTACQATEVCQETTAGTAECLVDCNKAGTPCAAGGTCTNGVCTCAANKAGKFCQHDCDPVCAAGTECKENAAGDDGECSGASALLATWIIFLAAAFSFI